MRILERIEDQIASTQLPLVGITLAAVPCPDTPVILTLHWHGFIKEKLAEVEEAQTVSYTPIPSSALAVNDCWRLSPSILLRWKRRGRSVRGTSLAPSARAACACAKRRGARMPAGFRLFPTASRHSGRRLRRSRRRRASATRRPTRLSLKRGCSGRSEAASGREHAADATLGPEGTRPAPCPHRPIPPVCDGKRQTVPVRHPRRRPL